MPRFFLGCGAAGVGPGHGPGLLQCLWLDFMTGGTWVPPVEGVGSGTHRTHLFCISGWSCRHTALGPSLSRPTASWPGAHGPGRLSGLVPLRPCGLAGAEEGWSGMVAPGVACVLLPPGSATGPSGTVSVVCSPKLPTCAAGLPSVCDSWALQPLAFCLQSLCPAFLSLPSHVGGFLALCPFSPRTDTCTPPSVLPPGTLAACRCLEQGGEEAALVPGPSGSDPRASLVQPGRAALPQVTLVLATREPPAWTPGHPQRTASRSWPPRCVDPGHPQCTASQSWTCSWCLCFSGAGSSVQGLPGSLQTSRRKESGR